MSIQTSSQGYRFKSGIDCKYIPLHSTVASLQLTLPDINL